MNPFNYNISFFGMYDTYINIYMRKLCCEYYCGIIDNILWVEEPKTFPKIY